MDFKLKGVVKVRSKGKDYYYAWRGGPKLDGKPGSPEFIASYNQAVQDYKTPDKNRFLSLVTAYKSSKEYKGLADSTRKRWAPWLDQIGKDFGPLQIAQFNKLTQIRMDIRKWRSQWTDRPRSADYGMQVLSRLLSYAVEQGTIASNPCEGIKQLYKGDRSEIIWTDADIAQLKKGSAERPCPAEVAHAVDLASHTGLRREDLLLLSWSHVSEDAIVMATRKSRGRREVIIPLYDALRDVLSAIPKRSTTILTNSKHSSWTPNGFSTAFNRAKHAAKIAGRDLHLHDLRGTAATRFYLAGLKVRLIAEIMGWEEDYVERIIRRYVGRSAAMKEMIRQLNEARK